MIEIVRTQLRRYRNVLYIYVFNKIIHYDTCTILMIKYDNYREIPHNTEINNTELSVKRLVFFNEVSSSPLLER